MSNDRLSLVLSRKRDETIVINLKNLIGTDLFVTVVDIRGDKVRLMIDAPREIPIHRKEVYDMIMQNQPMPPEPNSLTNQP